MEDTEKLIDGDAPADSASVKTEGSKKKAPKTEGKIATIGETFSFAFETGSKATICFVLGTLSGILNGLVRILSVACPFLSNGISLILLAVSDAVWSCLNLDPFNTIQISGIPIPCIYLLSGTLGLGCGGNQWYGTPH